MREEETVGVPVAASPSTGSGQAPSEWQGKKVGKWETGKEQRAWG